MLESRLYVMVGTFSAGCCLALLCRHSEGAIKPAIEQVRRELKPLDFTTRVNSSAALQEYLSYYGLSISEADHRIGTFASGTNSLAAQIFTPKQSRGTVITCAF